MNANTKVLEVKDLVRTFTLDHMENTVIDHISFDIAAGEFVAIMGQSGSGKSTLLYNISGMDAMTSGQVLMNGIDLAHKSKDELAELRLTYMGFIFQNNYLLKNLSLIDNICLPGFKSKQLSVSQVRETAEQLMEKLGIHEVKDHPIHKVSGGQRQRAALCRALINKPKILFADEPTGALNSRTSKEVLALFNQLNQEQVTILTVTHDPHVASVTDRIIYLKDGRIEAELTLGKFTDPLTQRQREDETLAWLLEMGF